MKDKINNKRLLHKMEGKNLHITSVDYDNNTILCDDGNEYPLMEGCENLTIEELQEQLNNAKDVVCQILKKNME